MTATWPSGLPHQPLLDGLVHRLPEPRLRTETDAGPARVRRLSTKTVQLVEQSWSFTRQQYELWRAWYRHEADEGAAWFTLPLWTGAGFATCEARFAQRPRPRARRALWLVAAQLETYDMPVVELEDLEPAWLDQLPYQPVTDSPEPTLHEDLLRSDWPEGPIAARRRFNTPARQDQAWDFTNADYELFRAWYRLALLDGTRWFTLPVWTGDRYRDCQARFAEPPEARWRGGVAWRVEARLELKLLPTLGVGEMQGALSASALHHLVHVVLPASLPA